MKKLLLMIATGLFAIQLATAQELSREFGIIGQPEIDLTKYARDPSAEAVVLFDCGETRFVDTQDYGYDIKFTQSRRIKIFTKAGISWSEVSIPIYKDEKGTTEKLESVEAFSYNWENGQLNRTSLDRSTVYEEKISKTLSMMKFVIPNTKPGSVIEYRVTKISPFLLQLPDWKFQDAIPTIYSRYVARMIPFYEYAFIVQGSTRFDLQTSVKDPEVRTWGNLASDGKGNFSGEGVRFNDLINTYVMKDVPAFRDEAYITSREDYILKMDFQASKFTSPRGTVRQIISTWPLLIEELQKDESFGKFLKACEKPARKIFETEIDTVGKSQVEKCKAIINYVKKGYKWDEFNSFYASRSMKELTTQKIGNAAEINLFMAALLKVAGINVSPVIISTRKHGKVNSNYPFLHYFNYVVDLVTIGDKGFLCDGTATYTDFNKIPARCINDKGLVVSNGEVKWISLNFDYKSVDRKTLSVNIDPSDLRMKTRIVIQAAEFDAYFYKDNFENDTVKIRKHLNDLGLQAVTNISTVNYDRNDLAYTISAEGESEVEKIDNKLVISPFLNLYPKENLLKQPSRNYPIDFIYANTESFKCVIVIPDGYRVLTLPEAFDLDNNNFMIKSSATSDGKVIEMSSEYSFKKAVYPPSEYSNIRNYFEMVIKRFNEQVILVKI